MSFVLFVVIQPVRISKPGSPRRTRRARRKTVPRIPFRKSRLRDDGTGIYGESTLPSGLANGRTWRDNTPHDPEELGTGSRRSAAKRVPVPISAPANTNETWRGSAQSRFSFSVVPGDRMPGIPFRKTHFRLDSTTTCGEITRRSAAIPVRAGSVSAQNTSHHSP